MSVLSATFYTNLVLFATALMAWTFPTEITEATRISKFIERAVIVSGLAFPVIFIVAIWSNVK